MLFGQGIGTQPQQQQQPFQQQLGQQQQPSMFQQQPQQGQGFQPLLGQQQGGLQQQQQPSIFQQTGALGQLGQQPQIGALGLQPQNPQQGQQLGIFGPQGNQTQNPIQGLGLLQPQQQQGQSLAQLGQQQQGQLQLGQQPQGQQPQGQQPQLGFQPQSGQQPIQGQQQQGQQSQGQQPQGQQAQGQPTQGQQPQLGLQFGIGLQQPQALGALGQTTGQLGQQGQPLQPLGQLNQQQQPGLLNNQNLTQPQPQNPQNPTLQVPTTLATSTLLPQAQGQQGQNPLQPQVNQQQGQQQGQQQQTQQNAPAQQKQPRQPAQLPDLQNRPYQQIKMAANRKSKVQEIKSRDPAYYLQQYNQEIQFYKFRCGIQTGSSQYKNYTTMQLYEAIDNRIAFIQSRYGISSLNNNKEKDKFKQLINKINVSQKASLNDDQFKSIIQIDDIQSISIDKFNEIRLQQLDILEYFEAFGVSQIQEQEYFIQYLNDTPEKVEVDPRSLTITSYTQLEQSQSLYESIFSKTSLTESIHTYSKELRNRRCAAGQIFKSLQQCRLNINQELKVLEHQFYVDDPSQARDIIHNNTINYLQNEMASEFKDFRGIHLNRIFTKEYLNSLINVGNYNFKIEQDYNGFYPSGILFLLIRCGKENEARRTFNEVKLKHGVQQRQYEQIFDLIEIKMRGVFDQDKIDDFNFQCTDNLLYQCYTLLLGYGFVDGALSNIHVKKDPYLLIWMNLKICSLVESEQDSGQLTIEDLQDASLDAGVINNIYVQNFPTIVKSLKQEPNSLVGLLLYIVISNLGLINQKDKRELKELREIAKTYALQYFGVLIKFDKPTAFLILQLTLQQEENYRQEYLSAVSDQLIRLDYIKPVFTDTKHLKQIKQILEGQEPQILYDDLQLECISNYIQYHGHRAFIEFTQQLKDINQNKMIINQQIDKIYQKFIQKLTEIQDILLLLKTRNDGYAKDFIGNKIFDLHILWFLSILIITIEEKYNYKNDKLREFGYPFQNLKDLIILIKQNGYPLWKKLIEIFLKVQESVNKKNYYHDPSLLELFPKEEIQTLSRQLIQKSKHLFLRGLYLYVDMILQLDKNRQKPDNIEKQYSEINLQFKTLSNKQLIVFDRVLQNSYDQVIQDRLINAGLS